MDCLQNTSLAAVRHMSCSMTAARLPSMTTGRRSTPTESFSSPGTAVSPFTRTASTPTSFWEAMQVLPLVMILALMGPGDRMDPMPGEALFLATNRQHEAVGTDSQMRTPGKPVTNVRFDISEHGSQREPSGQGAGHDLYVPPQPLPMLKWLYNQARQFVVGHGIAEGPHQQDGPCQGSDHFQGAESAQSGKCLAKDDPRPPISWWWTTW